MKKILFWSIATILFFLTIGVASADTVLLNETADSGTFCGNWNCYNAPSPFSYTDGNILVSTTTGGKDAFYNLGTAYNNSILNLTYTYYDTGTSTPSGSFFSGPSLGSKTNFTNSGSENESRYTTGLCNLNQSIMVQTINVECGSGTGFSRTVGWHDVTIMYYPNGTSSFYHNGVYQGDRQANNPNVPYKYVAFHKGANGGNSFKFDNLTVILESAPPSGGSFSITADDQYTSAALTNFSAYTWRYDDGPCIPNDDCQPITTYGDLWSTTNGTIVTTIPSDDSSEYQILVFSNQNGGYFNRTYGDNYTFPAGGITGYNVSSDLAAELHQSEITFYATKKITGENITGFNITEGSNTNESTNPTLRPNAAEHTFTLNKYGFYAQTLTTNVSALEIGTRTVTNVYDYILNVSINVLSGPASDQNFNLTIRDRDSNFSEEYSTNNGYVDAQLVSGINYTVWLNDTIHALTPYNITLNSSSNYSTITIDVFTTNTFNLSFYNESNNELLDNKTIQLELIAPSFAQNYSTSNGRINLSLLTPDDYTLRYTFDNEVIRDYYVTLTDQSYNEIRLYLIDEDISADYLPVVEDENGFLCSDQTVSLMRYFIDINGYRVVEMDKTDTNGQGVLRVRPNIINYKLAFSGSCGNFTTTPEQFVSTTNTYTVTTSQSTLTSANALASASTSMEFVNTTNTFVFTWADTDNVVTRGCLTVYKTRNGVKSTNYTACSDSSSGSLIYTLTGNTTDNVYEGTGSLETNTRYSTYYIGPAIASFNEKYLTWGLNGLLMAFLIILALVMLFGSNAATVVLASIAGLVVSVSLGIIGELGVSLTAIIVFAAILLYKFRT